MEVEAIADVLEVQSVTVSNWFFRAAKQCELINKELMKDLNVSNVEMDELLAIIEIKVAPIIENEGERSWIWISFAPEFRLIIDFIIGPRKQDAVHRKFCKI